jgi:flagellar biosynthesis protein FlhB
MEKLIRWAEIFGRSKSLLTKLAVIPAKLIISWLQSAIIITVLIFLFAIVILLASTSLTYAYKSPEFTSSEIIRLWLNIFFREGSLDLFLVLFAISIAIGILSAFLERALYHLKMAKRGKALSSLKNLFQEVIRYNNLVRGASVKLRLSAIKNELDEADIKKLEQVFSSMQDELVKALKIERLLR